MSSGDELYARAIFSSEDVKRDVDEYMLAVFKRLFRITMIRKTGGSDTLDLQFPLDDERMMLQSFIANHADNLVQRAVRDELLRVYVREELHSYIDQAMTKALDRKLKEFERAFKRNKTIPKGVLK
jgi:hypothetical protein